MKCNSPLSMLSTCRYCTEMEISSPYVEVYLINNVNHKTYHAMALDLQSQGCRISEHTVKKKCYDLGLQRRVRKLFSFHRIRWLWPSACRALFILCLDLSLSWMWLCQSRSPSKISFSNERDNIKKKLKIYRCSCGQSHSTVFA